MPAVARRTVRRRWRGVGHETPRSRFGKWSVGPVRRGAEAAIVRTMILEYSMVSDSLSVTNSELGQVHHALSILDRGIRRELESLNTEIDRLREQNRNYGSDRDCDDHATLCDLGAIRTTSVSSCPTRSSSAS